MPSIAQQDYKVIAPKPGRDCSTDAAALGELKKAVLNGIGFDCLLKDIAADEGTLGRILGFHEDSFSVDVWDAANSQSVNIELPCTVTQYQGLAAVQQAVDEKYGLMGSLPLLTTVSHNYLSEDDLGGHICVDNKYLIITVGEGGKLTSLTMADTGPSQSDTFVNITWEDAQKLIGLHIN